MSTIELRPIEDGDLDALFEQQRDPVAVHMAAFTRPDPDDRAAFDEHMARIRDSDLVTMRAVLRDGVLVGSVASFVLLGETAVTYWIDRSAWGTGVASRALALLLEEVTTRPIYARAASDNIGSLRVLAKAGFVVTGTERSFANARGVEIEETLLRKD